MPGGRNRAAGSRGSAPGAGGSAWLWLRQPGGIGSGSTCSQLCASPKCHHGGMHVAAALQTLAHLRAGTARPGSALQTLARPCSSSTHAPALPPRHCKPSFGAANPRTATRQPCKSSHTRAPAQQTPAQPHASTANPHTLMQQHCKPSRNHAPALQTLAPCCPDTANPLSARPTASIPRTAACRHRKPSSLRLGTPHSFAHPCRGGCAPVRTRAGCCRPGELAPRYR